MYNATIMYMGHAAGNAERYPMYVSPRPACPALGHRLHVAFQSAAGVIGKPHHHPHSTLPLKHAKAPLRGHGREESERQYERGEMERDDILAAVGGEEGRIASTRQKRTGGRCRAAADSLNNVFMLDLPQQRSLQLGLLSSKMDIAR